MAGRDALSTVPKGAPARSPGRSLALVASIALLAMVIAWVVLSALNGPTEDGFRCHRAAGQSGQCEILRSRFFGLAGNSAYPVGEDLIHGAVARCGHAQVGRASSSCNVYLVLQSGASELVLSFALPSQAEDAARRANRYIADHSQTALEIRESVVTTVILWLVAPVLLVALLLWLRWLRVQQASLRGDKES